MRSNECPHPFLSLRVYRGSGGVVSPVEGRVGVLGRVRVKARQQAGHQLVQNAVV